MEDDIDIEKAEDMMIPYYEESEEQEEDDDYEETVYQWIIKDHMRGLK